MTMKVTHYYIYIGVLAAGMLLAGCSKDSGDSTQQVGGEPQEIRVQTNVTSMLKGSRATTINSNSQLQTYDLKIDAYYNGTNEKYLDATKLHYTGGDPTWVFWDGSAQLHYYWPIDGSTVTIAGNPTTASTLDFVGFCPFDKPAYIGTPTYNHSTGVSFTCDMSSYMTLDDQEDMQEFLVSVLPNQTLAAQTAEGALPMVFKHPLAVIKFTITAASGTHVKINSIKLTGLKTAGTCTYDGTTMDWGEYSGSADMTITQELKNGGTTETSNFLVIPNNYDSKYLTVNATWDDWSNTVTISDYGTNVDFNWQAGYIYTYNLTLDKLGLKVVIENKYTEQW